VAHVYLFFVGMPFNWATSLGTGDSLWSTATHWPG